MVDKIFDLLTGEPYFGSLPGDGREPLLLSLLCFILIVGIMIKVFLDRYSSVIYFCIVLITFYVAGRISHYYFRSESDILSVSLIVKPFVFKIVLPIILYYTVLRLINIKFLGVQNSGRVLSLGLLIYVMNFFILFGVLIGAYGLCFDWQLRSLSILSICLNLYQPELLIVKLESQGGHIKYLQSLLKGEVLTDVLTSFTTCDILYKIGPPDFYPKETNSINIVITVFLQLAGILVGIVYALISQVLCNFVSSNTAVATLISFPLVFVIYSSAELAGSSGCAAVCAYGIATTVFVRPKMAESDEKFSCALWDIVYFNTKLYLIASTGFILGAINREHDIRMLCYGISLFTMTVIMRAFFGFLLLPYMYAKGEAKWKEIGLAVFGPYRGVHSLLLALRFATENTDESYQTLIIVIIVVNISQFFNIILLDWFLHRLDVFHLTKPQISNMNSAVDRINKCRANMIFAEKLDRIVADANWSVVSAITDFPHPYKDRLESGDSFKVFKEEIKTVECPKCGAWSIAPPTKKETDDSTREAKLSVLKAQEVSYLKQRETGTLSTQGYKFLSNIIYQASYSESVLVDTDDLRIVAEDMKCRKNMESILRKVYISTMDAYDWVPKNSFRQSCYHIMTSHSFKIAMAICSLLDMFLSLLLFALYKTYFREDGVWPTAVLYYGEVISAVFPLFYMSNVVELLIQLCGVGLSQFFAMRAYVIEFFSCAVTRSLQMCLFLHQCSLNGQYMNMINCDKLIMYMTLLMFFRISRIYIFVVSLIPTALHRIEKSIGRSLLKKYDIGKAYLVGLDRALKYSGQLSNNDEILEAIRKEIEGNRQKVSKEMGMIQKEHPTIAITVKTKHAIRHVINAMSACCSGLLNEGILDSIEYNALNKPIEKLKMKLRELNVIVPPSSINIIREISWLVGDPENTELFLNQMQMFNYDYNDNLIRNGDDPIGLYILVSGLLKATYVPSTTSIQLAAKFGVLPNYDFFENFKFDQPQEEYIVSGNVIGELGAVSGRRYDMTVSAETAVQVFFVSWETIKSLHETTSGRALLDKIWKKIAQKISMTLLQFTGAYRHWTRERLYSYLLKGTMPNLNGIVAMQLDYRIEEAVLIEGAAMDVTNQTIIYGPYRIPKTVTRLWFPEHRSWDFQTVYPARIYVVLAAGATLHGLLETKQTDDDLSSAGGSDRLRKKEQSSRKVGFFNEEGTD